MALEDFNTSTRSQSQTENTTQSQVENLSTDVVADPEDIEVPDYVSPWVSGDGLLVMMDISPRYVKEHVSIEVKDRAKEESLICLDDTGCEPVIVLTDDPREYGTLLETFGLEEYLQKRCRRDI